MDLHTLIGIGPIACQLYRTGIYGSISLMSSTSQICPIQSEVPPQAIGTPECPRRPRTRIAHIDEDPQTRKIHQNVALSVLLERGTSFLTPN